MADGTAIEWSDATWNPLTGCTKVSPGCDNCYAETFAERFRGVPGHHFEQGFDLQLRPERLQQPIRWQRPRRIFVNSMSDLFHKDVPTEFIAQVFAVMSLAPQHTFQMLTKRHARMRALLNDPTFEQMVRACAHEMKYAGGRSDPRMNDENYQTWPLPNVWLGVSVEDQKWADIRIPALLATPAKVRWISAEPLLGPIDLREWTNELPEDEDGAPYLGGLNWVVAGGESGPGARPMHPDWARAIREQCAEAGVPFLFKQWGAWQPQPVYSTNERHHVVQLDGTDRGVPWSGWGLDQPTAAVMERVGKKSAGRDLDGVTHDGYPEPIS